MNHQPRIRTVVSCTLLVAALGAVPPPAAATTAIHCPPSRTTRRTRSPSTARRGRQEGRPRQAPGSHRQGRRRPHHGRDGHRRRGTLCGGRTLRRRHPLAQHRPAGRRRPLHGQGDHRGRGRAPRAAGPSPSPPARREEAPEVTFGPKAGTYGVGQPITAELSASGQGQGGSGHRRTRPARWIHPRRAGRLVLGGRQDLHYRPKEYWPANATIEVRSNLDGHQGHRPALGRRRASR